MLVPIQLTHEQDVFDVLTDVFDQAEREGLIESSYATDERDSYGNDGYISIKVDGRTFRVQLSEVVY